MLTATHRVVLRGIKENLFHPVSGGFSINLHRILDYESQENTTTVPDDSTTCVGRSYRYPIPFFAL